jgi:MFS family permease
MAAASMREKRLTLAAAVLGSSIVFLDATVIGIALPAIESDLGGGLAGQQWLTDAYLLALGSLLLIGGSLGDIFGQRRVFFIGVAGFGLTSMLCALPSSIACSVPSAQHRASSPRFYCRARSPSSSASSRPTSAAGRSDHGRR